MRRPTRPNHSKTQLLRLLLLVPAVMLLSLIVPPRAAPAAVLPVFEDSDVLLVQPTEGVTLDALSRALTELGYSVIDGGDAAAVVRIAVRDGDDPLALAEAIAGSGLARGVEPDAVLRTARIPGGALVDQ
ncbi:hypothetical protein HOH51_03725, partial [bacterium]|nr:hypothetical protein [bacterium]